MKAKEGDIVIVVYDGFLENDEIFETSDSAGPLEFTIGSNTVFPDFEQNVIGMIQGETKSFILEPDQAMGLTKPELVQTINKSNIPNQENLKTGIVLGLTIDKGGKKHQVPATVVSIDADTVTVDYNHPLVGKKLKYKVTLQSIKESA